MAVPGDQFMKKTRPYLEVPVVVPEEGVSVRRRPGQGHHDVTPHRSLPRLAPIPAAVTAASPFPHWTTTAPARQRDPSPTLDRARVNLSAGIGCATLAR